MRIHLIGDRLFRPELGDKALASATELGLEVSRSSWEHETLGQYRADVLASEQTGPASVKYPPDFAAIPGLDQVEFLIVQFCPVAAAFIEAAPKLKGIGVVRVGVENVDLAAAAKAGIAVYNTVGRNARAVAEYSITMLLAERRDIVRAHMQMVAGEWQIDFPGTSQRRELGGRTIGIVGAGRVGQLCAKILAGGYECTVLMHDPYVTSFPAFAEAVALDELLARSDDVILHARLDGASKHLIGARELALMQDGAVLVNTARAGLVDEAALVAALCSGKLAGAALDVYASEPLPADHPLTQLPNVILTPHIAGVTVEAYDNGPNMMAEIVAKLAAGERDSLTPVVP